jgi:starch phosphorylase
MLLADYASYIACQERVDALYHDQEAWSRRAILNIAGMGRFSSDRSILEYADKIWNVQPVRRGGAGEKQASAGRKG